MVAGILKTLIYNFPTLDVLPTLLPYALIYVDLPVHHPDDKYKMFDTNWMPSCLSCFLGLPMCVDLLMQAHDDTNIIKLWTLSSTCFENDTLSFKTPRPIKNMNKASGFKS